MTTPHHDASGDYGAQQGPQPGWMPPAPHSGQSPYSPGYAAGPPRPVASDTDKLIAVAAHASSYFGFVLIVPLVLFIVCKDRNAFVRNHVATALDAHLWLAIWGAIATVVAFTAFGLPLALVMIAFIALYALITPILAIIAVADSQPFKYPLCPAIFAR